MTPGRLLYLIRRRARLGLKHWYAERFLFDRITEWRSNENPPSAHVPLHLLASRHDWKMALWMLVSFHEATARRWTVILHEDGSLGEREFSIYRTMFPGIRIITRREADNEMEIQLNNFPLCAEYRRRMPHGLKSFDIPYFSQSDRFLMIDPDVLFFQRPQEILDWADLPADGSCWFNQDFQEPSPISPEQARRDIGVDLWPRVNTGLCLLNKNTVSDLSAMDSYLTHPALQDPKIQWRIEQTLLALCASRVNKGGLLPLTYEVSPNKHRRPDCVARHYVGCVRDRFLGDGVILLHKKIL
jgi:hypothetical protein